MTDYLPKRKRARYGSPIALESNSGHTHINPKALGESNQHNGDIINIGINPFSVDADILPETIQRNRLVDTPRNDLFCGRQDILSQMHKNLKPPDERNSNSRQQSCVLFGLGGVGKTQIANEYTYRYKEDYGYIFWIQSEKGPELAENYSAIASSMKVHDSVWDSTDQKRNIKIAKDWLSNTKASWLLIFDNVSEMNLIRSYIPANSAGSIIITTQLRDIDLPKSLHIHVDGLPLSDGSSLLSSIVERAVDEELTRHISELVGGLPLAIAQIGGYINKSQSSIEEFLKIYNRKSSWYGRAGPALTTYVKTLQNVFDIALGALKPDARNLLDSIAFLSPENIWEDIFFRNHEHPSLQFLQDDEENTKMFELRTELIERCLINRVGSGENYSSSSISIHRSLKDNLLYRLSEENDLSDYHKVFRQAFHLIRAVTPRQSPRSSPTYQFPEYEKRLPHILSLCSIYDNSRKTKKKLEPTLEFAELLSDIGNYMWERNLLKDAFRILGTAEAICNEVLEPEDPNPIRTQIIYLQASFELDHGCIMREQGLRHKEQILRLRKKRLDFSTPDEKETDELQMSTASNNLGCAHIQCEDYESAAPLLEEALKIKLRWGDETSEKTASGIAEQYKNLALVAISRGQVEKALKLSDDAVRVFTNWRGPDSTGTLFHRFMRASILFNVGDLHGALKESIEVLEMKKKVLDEDSNELFDSHYAVGMMQHLDNNLTEAESNLRQCLDHRDQNYETTVARALYRLSLVLEDQGKHPEAATILSEARDLKNHIVSRACLGVDLNEKDEAVIFDQMVTCWAGRFGGKQNVKWQEQLP